MLVFFQNIDFNVIICTNVTKDVLKEHKIVNFFLNGIRIVDEIISYKMCAVKVRNAKLRNYLKLHCALMWRTLLFCSVKRQTILLIKE
jgi:uncharacterized membrane protein YiaA